MGSDDAHEDERQPVVEETRGTSSGSHGPGRARKWAIYVPDSRLKEHLILSSTVELLALAAFVLTLAWDQQLWLAAVALPLACFSAFYALWCARTLRTVAIPPG